MKLFSLSHFLLVVFLVFLWKCLLYASLAQTRSVRGRPVNQVVPRSFVCRGGQMGGLGQLPYRSENKIISFWFLSLSLPFSTMLFSQLPIPGCIWIKSNWREVSAVKDLSDVHTAIYSYACTLHVYMCSVSNIYYCTANCEPVACLLCLNSQALNRPK